MKQYEKGLGSSWVMSYGGDMSKSSDIAKQDGFYAAPQMRDTRNHSWLRGTFPG